MQLYYETYFRTVCARTKLNFLTSPASVYNETASAFMVEVRLFNRELFHDLA